MATRLVSQIQNKILWLTLESEDGYPRLESGVLAALAREMERAHADRAIAGCVITGSSKAFAAGAEISELAALGYGEGFAFARRGQSVMNAVAACRVAVVAAIRGFCFGGGLDLALACRARVATADAVFAHPGGALGIMTGWGGTQRLPRLIGRSAAVEMFVTGRRVAADEALGLGLVSRIVAMDELAEAAVREMRLEVDGR